MPVSNGVFCNEHSHHLSEVLPVLNFRPLSLTTSACVDLFIKLTISIVNALMPLPNCVQCDEFSRHLSFGNFRPLTLTTSACVNLFINLLLLRTRAIVNTITLMNTLAILRATFVTFDRYRCLLRLASIFI